MATRVFQIQNGAMPTTAAFAPVATGAVVRTIQQLATPATLALEVCEWGISFDGFAAVLPGRCELINTFAVAATSLTANVAADVTKVSQAAAGMASQVTYGTGATGFYGGSGVEGTITATRQFDTQFLPPTAPYVKQWPLELGPEMLLSEFLRIRTTFGATVNCYSYIVWKE